MKKILAILLALIMVLGMSAAFAETTGRIGVAMPTKSSERWIRDGNSVKEGLEAQGYEVDLQYAEDNIAIRSRRSRTCWCRAWTRWSSPPSTARR